MNTKKSLAIAIGVICVAFILAMAISDTFYVWVMARVYDLLLFVLIFIAGWLLGRFGDKLK